MSHSERLIVRLPESLKQKLETLAAAGDSTVSRTVRKALEALPDPVAVAALRKAERKIDANPDRDPIKVLLKVLVNALTSRETDLRVEKLAKSVVRKLRKDLPVDGTGKYRGGDTLQFKQENSDPSAFPEGFVAAQLENMGIAPNDEQTTWGQGDSPEADSEYRDSDVAGQTVKKSFMSDDMIARTLTKNLGVHVRDIDLTGLDSRNLRKSVADTPNKPAPAPSTGNTFAANEDYFIKRELKEAERINGISKFFSQPGSETLLEKSMVDRDGGRRDPEELQKLARNIHRGSDANNDVTESIAEMFSTKKLRKA